MDDILDEYIGDGAGAGPDPAVPTAAAAPAEGASGPYNDDADYDYEGDAAAAAAGGPYIDDAEDGGAYYEGDGTPRAPIPATTATLAETRAARYCFDDPALARDRLAATILGAAVGDALGLQVEGDEPGIIAERHPKGVNYPYKGVHKGYPNSDWTDATDFTVLLMRSLGAYLEGKTEDPAVDFAIKIAQWSRSGFPELLDATGVGPEGVVGRALANKGFTTDPVAAARDIKGPKAENGALIRTAAAAFTAAPAEWAATYCEVTHADDRCAATATMLTLLINQLARIPAGARVPPTLPVAAIDAGRQLIETEARRNDYMKRLTDSKSLSALALGDRDNRSYTVKTCAVAMWAFRQLVKTPPAERDAEFFRKALRAVAAQGGDASANCAVAGAVLGAALGVAALPADWLDAMPNRKWLDAEIEAFYERVAPTWELPE